MRALIAVAMAIVPFCAQAAELSGPPAPRTKYVVTSMDQLPHAKSAFDAPFVFVSSVHMGTMLWDVNSTFAKLDRCSSCFEANPFLRPFVKQGRGTTFAVSSALTLGAQWSSLRMKSAHRHHPRWLARNAWWMTQAIPMIAHTALAIHNQRIPNDRPSP